MKSILNFLLVFVTSSILSIFIYINYYQINDKRKIDEKPKLIPTSYSYNIGNSILQKTDFTNAAEKTINAVVHVKNTSTGDDQYSWLYRNFYGIDSLRKE